MKKCSSCHIGIWLNFLNYGQCLQTLAYKDYPEIRGFCADAGYRGTFELEVKEKLNIGVDISERVSGNKWEILPKRWIVERTFSWMNHSRGLSKDYEITKSSSEAMIKIAHSHILLKRL